MALQVATNLAAVPDVLIPFLFFCFLAAVYLFLSEETRGELSRFFSATGVALSIVAVCVLAVYVEVWLPSCADVPWWFFGMCNP